jgi:hypothetical protein
LPIAIDRTGLCGRMLQSRASDETDHHQWYVSNEWPHSLDQTHAPQKLPPQALIADQIAD